MWAHLSVSLLCVSEPREWQEGMCVCLCTQPLEEGALEMSE